MFLHYCDLIATEEPIIYHVFAYFGNLTVQNSQIRGTNARKNVKYGAALKVFVFLFVATKIRRILVI
jgi:hypothetical protein